MGGGRSSLVEIALYPGESVTFAIRGDCMPGLAERAHVRRQRWYLPGDVVVVRRRNYFDVHRFLGYAPGTRGIVALTQADVALEPDPAASIDAIVGRAEHDVTTLQRLRAAWLYAKAVQRRFRRGWAWPL